MDEAEIAREKTIDVGGAPKILFLDIETSPEQSATWGVRKIDRVLWHRMGEILMVGYKWRGDKKPRVISQKDYAGWSPKKSREKVMMHDIWDLMDEADVITGYNGDAFDIKVINARFIKYKIPEPSRYQTSDPLKIIRRVAKFPSHKLEDVAVYLGLDAKMQTGGKYLWKKVMEGDMQAWKHMEKYCKQDVLVLEQVDERVEPWNKSPLNRNFYERQGMRCTNILCGSTDFIFRGYDKRRTGYKRRMTCNVCQKRFLGPFIRDGVEAVKTYNN